MVIGPTPPGTGVIRVLHQDAVHLPIRRERIDGGHDLLGGGR